MDKKKDYTGVRRPESYKVVAESPHEKLWQLLHRIQRIDRESIKKSFAHHLEFTVGKNRYTLSIKDVYLALAYTVRDHLIDYWNETQQTYYDKDAKRVYYLSMEFLMGRSLENALINMRTYAAARKAMEDLGFDLEEIIEMEQDAGLGNGGLGRLAACFLDSMATMSLPGFGYGIRYDYGIFKQKIVRGFQTEIPDLWLAEGNPWEIERFDFAYPIRFYGHVETSKDEKGEVHFTWIEGEKVLAKPYDIPIPGYNSHTVNNLRLWSAEPTMEFNFEYFNEGDYIRAVEEKINSENISSVLYPNDKLYAGKELRLKQQFFMVSASLQDIIRRFSKAHKDNWDMFPEKNAIQLNDTHPALAIAEFMRILLDLMGLGWDRAWKITVKSFAYTNHTVLPEALEKWSVSLLERLLPRHMQIIYEINSRFLEEVKLKFPGDKGILSRVSLIEEGVNKKVCMAYLAIIGSHTVNGVAKLHSRLIRETIFADFYKLYPERFQNKTNGITQRRWLAKANKSLAKLITKKIGRKWITDLSALRELEKYSDDEDFQNEWHSAKERNKRELAGIISEKLEIMVSPDSMFDIQIKRFHEYKRQHMNIFHAIALYQKIKKNPNADWTPRTVIFSGKAAPGYYVAKLIIKLIHAVAGIINSDKKINDLLKIVFIPDYSVSLAEKIIPACDLSEQISTAGKEASGTGNMKFALNGALTIGTLDGANIEMTEEIGEENIFIFGLGAGEIQEMVTSGAYKSTEYYRKNELIQGVFHFIYDNFHTKGDMELYTPLLGTLLEGGDPFFVLADFTSYLETQDLASRMFKDRKSWVKKAIINSCRMGKFSSDRTIGEYARDIWKVDPVKIDPPSESRYWAD